MQGRAHIEGVQRVGAEAAVLAVVVGGGDVVICQVAAAVPCGQQLAAKARLPLEERDGAAVFLRRQCRRHTGRTAADDENVRHFAPSSLRRVR